MEELVLEIRKLSNKKVEWKKITRDQLDLDYSVIISTELAQNLFNFLEETIIYESAENSQIKVFGKWFNIPRQQSAYGDPGTSYRFSGKNVPAKPWTPVLFAISNFLSDITGFHYNFVIINRYANGSNHIGEHKDNEPDLNPNAPIASLSLGQSRDFLLKHGDARKKGPDKKNIPLVKVPLQNGSLLLMNAPTNKFWYHSLPPRKLATGVRINLTFRCLKKK